MHPGSRVLVPLLVLTLAACTGGSDGEAQRSTAPAGSDDASSASGSYPAAPTATAHPADVIATKKGSSGWSMALTGVRRVGDQRIVVEAVLDGSHASQNLVPFAEPGFTQLKDASGQVTQVINGEFSGVTLTVPGDDATYLPLRDRDNVCLCTRLGSSLADPTSVPVFVYLTAPPQASTVDLKVNGIGTFTKVQVS
jgi:hypothetical protein